MASALSLSGAAALAQSAPVTTPTPASPSADPIGPPQLSNFSLGGKVVQPAQPATEIQPIARPNAAHGTDKTLTAPDSLPVNEARPVLRGHTAQRQTAQTSIKPSAELKVEPDSLQTTSNSVPPRSQAASLAAPAAIIQAAPVATQSAWLSSILWLLAVAAAAGAAAWYFLRQRPRTRFAPAGAISALEAPAAQPSLRAPPPAAPPPTIKPEPKPGGIVSTRLRPRVELQFTPGRVILDGEKAVLEFEMALFNSGSAPARDILIEGSLFNAGPIQDQQIATFFENPVGQGNRLPLLAPLQRLSITSSIALSRANLIPLEIEGRQLLVPLAGFNTLYRWGSSSEGQTSASYLVGKVTNGEKLAPFRLDLGPRVFRRLAAREHELRVRK